MTHSLEIRGFTLTSEECIQKHDLHIFTDKKDNNYYPFSSSKLLWRKQQFTGPKMVKDERYTINNASNAHGHMGQFRAILVPISATLNGANLFRVCLRIL